MAWIWVIPISWNNKSDLSGEDRYFRELANTFKSPGFCFFPSGEIKFILKVEK